MTVKPGMRELYLDTVHRRPSGWIGRLQYGGARGAPKDHEADFTRALEWLQPLHGERCLEIGCGGGVMLERVLAAGAESAAALDHSPDMLSCSGARNREALNRGTLQLALGDACQIPWPDRSFTVAYALNMFLFVERPEDMLAELFRVLVPGGRLVIATLPGPFPRPLRALWLSLWRFALHVYSESAMAALYADAGFVGVRMETVDRQQWSRAERPR